MDVKENVMDNLDQEYYKAKELLQRNKNKEAIAILRDIAERGHITSQRVLGTAYVSVNHKEAFYWFEKAAKNNDSISLNILGHMYFNGLGTEKSLSKAYEYFIKSADLGDVDAQSTVGDYYYYGDYVSPDHALAKKYYQLAYSQGDKHSSYMLGMLGLFEEDKSKNTYVDSIRYFEISKSSDNEKSVDVLNYLLNKSEPKPNYKEKIISLKSLIEKLYSEHKNGYYYRGQNHLFDDSPLSPSMYRYGYSRLPIYYDGEKRLRKTGTSFYFENSIAKSPSKAYKIKRLMSMYITRALGYTFTQAMFQQAGYGSEGIDITSDIAIALFFSTYDYKDGKFYIDPTRKHSVIYRWRTLANIKPSDSLQKNFYYCPNLIPTYDIFKSFKTCDSKSEFYQSLRDYSEAINWGNNFDLDMVMGNRPFSLIKLPKSYLEKSRVIKQKGSLLLRDYIISEDLKDALIRRGGDYPPAYMENLPQQLVQDLSEPQFCDVFYYKRDNELAEKILNELNINKEDVYNESVDNEDLSQLLLYGWLETCYKFYGPVINNSPVPNYNLSYNDILITLNEWQKKKSTNGYYFEKD